MLRVPFIAVRRQDADFLHSAMPRTKKIEIAIRTMVRAQIQDLADDLDR
jgi:hypothetical protein